MDESEAVLEHCIPAFARAWNHAEEVSSLFCGFIDAMALVRFCADGTAQLALAGKGFETLFEGMRCKGDNLFMHIVRKDRDLLISACRTALESGISTHVNVTWNIRRADNSCNDTELLTTGIGIESVGMQGDDALLYFAIQDASRRKSAEHSITRSQYASALNALFSEIFLLDIDTGETDPIYMDGKPLMDEDGEKIDCGFHAISVNVHPDDRQMLWHQSNHLVIAQRLFDECSQPAITFDLRRKGEDGRYHWISIYIARMANSQAHRTVLVCLRNIDEAKEAQRRERELRSRAENDSLTRIFNRGTTEDLILASLQAQGNSSLSLFAIIDVDDFKHVNDTYGHQMGDELLKGIALRLKGLARERDIVGRIGGDEFAVMFCGIQENDTAQIEKRMRDCMGAIATFSSDLGIDPAVTLSIGMVPVSSSDTSFHEIFKKADSLLYQVKDSGKNDYRLYHP